MLFNEDPSEIYDYGVIIFLFPESSKDIKDLITPPELLPKGINGNRLFRVIFNGLLWIFLFQVIQNISIKGNFSFLKKHLTNN